MELLSSRGYETTTHKAFMRLTVLVLDFAVYFSAVWVISKRLVATSSKGTAQVSHLWIAVVALCQPALVLIDHGHFQYNTTSLGLSLWSFHFMTLPRESGRLVCRSDIVGSIFFALGLNFKQMCLYHAPAVFFLLLGRCFFARSILSIARSVVCLSLAVVSTFAALWWPFCARAAADVGCVGGLQQIVRRLFPFSRGLFEDKVANLWLVLSVKPISIRNRLPQALQPVAALALTLVLLAYPGCRLFKAGGPARRGGPQGDGGLRALLWGSTATGLAFFLASFQVHEKSLLLALAPLSLLQADSPRLVAWLSLLGAWSMFPLLEKDKLQVPYVAMMVLYATLAWLFERRVGSRSPELGPYRLVRMLGVIAVVPLSFVGMVLLHVMSETQKPPASMPDLWPTLWAVVGCGALCFAYVVIVTRRWD